MYNILTSKYKQSKLNIFKSNWRTISQTDEQYHILYVQKIENKAFLFRRNIFSLDDDSQSSDIVGWQLPDDVSVDMYSFIGEATLRRTVQNGTRNHG